MQSEQLQQLVITALEDLKAIDLICIDVRELTSITDYMIICSGSSSRHVRSLADSVLKKANEHGIQELGVEGKELGEWTLLDLNDVVIHIMQPQIREFYSLEKLWGDVETASSVISNN